MSLPNGGRNTAAWRRARERVYATQTHCAYCGLYVDQTLPRTHPMGRTVDHPHELQEGGHLTDQALVLAHRSCNSSKALRTRNAKRSSNGQSPSRSWPRNVSSRDW